MIRTFISYCILGLIYAGLFGLVMAEAFYLVAELSAGRSSSTLVQLANGARISWDWIRNDNWGIETFFFVTEIFILGGLVWVYQNGKLRTKMTRDAAARIVAESKGAKQDILVLIEAYEKTDFSGLRNWRDAEETRLRELHLKARDQLRALHEKLGLESSRFGDHSEAAARIKDYRYFVTLVKHFLENLPNLSEKFVVVMSLQTPNLRKFARYNFAFHGKMPSWAIPLPTGADEMQTDYSYVNHSARGLDEQGYGQIANPQEQLDETS